MTARSAPRLLLHVGAHKTGTTAIQHALTALRPDLHRRGIAYPDLKPSLGGSGRDHNLLAHTLTRSELRRKLRLWRARHALWTGRGSQLTVLSSEAIFRHILVPSQEGIDGWFAAHDAYLAKVARFLRGFDVTALCYLRQPETAVISLFKENIVRGQSDGRLTLRQFIAARDWFFHYPRHIAALQRAFPTVEVVSFEAEAKAGLLAGFLARAGAADLAPPALTTLRSSPSNRATIWLQRAIGTVPGTAFRHRAVFSLRPEAEALFAEDAPSTLWQSPQDHDAFVAAVSDSYDLPFLKRPGPLTLPPTQWTDRMQAEAEQAFAAWSQRNAALLARREALRLRHYDPDPADTLA